MLNLLHKEYMKIDNSFDRYFGRHDEPNYKRYAYSVSRLFGRVLDVGCGDGFGIYLMKSNPNIESVVGLDICKEAIERARVKLNGLAPELIVAPAESLPFEDNSFDSVHCGQTLEHVKDEQKVISEIKRVTRGIAIISVPINGGISAQHLRQYDNRTILKALEGSFNILSMKMFHDGRHKRLVLIAE